ncbi:hypothetical protein Ccrd_006093, partial [Cynara cardunculus var. scolymus]
VTRHFQAGSSFPIQARSRARLQVSKTPIEAPRRRLRPPRRRLRPPRRRLKPPTRSIARSFCGFEKFRPVSPNYSTVRNRFPIVTVMAGVAPEGSQFDTRQFDTKMNEL